MTKKLVFPAVCVVLLGICASPVLAQRKVQVISNAVWSDPIQADVSAPLRSYPVHAGAANVHAPLHPKLGQLKAGSHTPGRGLNAPVGNNQPNVGLNFDGISDDPNASDNCPSASGFLVTPPDTNAAVGDTQIVEWVNLCYSVFDKATGNLVAGPFPGNHFWAGFGGQCQTENDGDPIIQWDKANHVWVASQNDFGPAFSGPFVTCVAVSTTADATGSYNRYQFPQSAGFPDYQKWGLAPHAYYQTQNIFGPSSFLGVNVCAYQADALRAGSKRAKQVCILDNSNGTGFDDSMLPADSDADPPTAGPAPEVLLGSIDNANPGSNVYEYVFTVTSFKGKGKATLAGVNGSMPMAVPAYSLACGGFGACIPQPSPGSDLLESLGDRLLYRLALFDDGVTQHFLVAHNVDDGVAVGSRWYEFTAPTGSTALSPAQSGQTPADGEFRWMGSIARDTLGNISLGYSRTSANTGDFPSIYVSGQTAGEAPGTTDAEVLVQAGGGSQIDGTSRWGDYSSMALDGADHCTFWYAGEYFAHDSQFFGDWYTHLAQVKFPGCP